MGRRERRAEKRKKTWRNIILAAMFLFVVIGMSLGGIGSFGGGSDMKYGKFKFYVKNNRYAAQINNQEMFFFFLPSQVDYINLSSAVANKLNEAFLVMITFNPEESANLQAMEVTRFDLSQSLGKVVYNGVLQISPEYDLPILTCANSTLKTPVIVLNVSDSTSIVEENNCIYLNARGTEFLRLRDRLLYSYYGVIEDE